MGRVFGHRGAWRLGILFAWVGAMMVAESAAGQIRHSAVGLSGGQAAGLPAGVNYRSFDLPVMNDGGDVAFLAALQGVGVTATNVGAIFAGAPGSLGMVAREGDPAPGAPTGMVYRELADAQLAINRTGQVIYDAVLVEPGTIQVKLALYGGAAPAVQLLAQGGDAAPGLGDGVTYQFDIDEDSRLVLSNGGRTAFFALLLGPGVSDADDEAVFVAGPTGTPTLVAREGSSAPGAPGGVNYGRMFRDVAPGLSGGGSARVGFVAGLGGAVTPADDQAIFAGAVEAVQLVARKGGAVPGATPGVTYGFFMVQPAVNDSGDIAFRAALLDPASATPQSEAVLAGPIGSPRVVARTGDAAPGVAGGVYATLPLEPPTLNETGEVAYWANVRQGGVDRSALYAGSPAAPRLIALGGDPAPGAAGGVTYARNFSMTPAMNDAGQVAYLAELNDDALPDSEGVGLFVFDPELGTSLVVRTGELFDVGGGEFRTIANGSNLFFSPIGFVDSWADVMGSGLGDDGRLAFRLQFTDGSSGVFVAMVPEPAGAAWVCAGVLVMARQRRRGAGRTRRQ